MIRIGFLEISWIDVVDVLLVSYLIYRFYKLIRGSVAVRIFVGIIAIYLLYLIVKSVGMELLTAILGQFIGLGMVAALILFQPEIRKFLLSVGRTSFFNSGMFNGSLLSPDPLASELNIEAIVTAISEMSATRTGALLVLGKRSELQQYMDTGNTLDAAISARLILSIFYKNSPMHDGAAIITSTKLRAAGCILPLTENMDLPPHLGLRHRAGIGITEHTDSLVIIVSEETGIVSIARNGKLSALSGPNTLREKLQEYAM